MSPTRFLLVSVLLLSWSVDTSAQATHRAEPSSVGFVENCGQMDGRVAFSTPLAPMQAFFGRDEILFSLPVSTAGEGERQLVRWIPIGARELCWRGERPLPGRVHFFRGRDPDQWVSDVATYGELMCRDVYPGIDLVYRQTAGLKSEWIVAPGADPEVIRWRYEGVFRAEIDGRALRLWTSSGELREVRPRFYQVRGEETLEIEGGFRIGEDGSIGFDVGRHDSDLPLLLDPDLEWSTFLGGTRGELAYAGGVDSQGNVFIAGLTESSDFPATFGVFQPTIQSTPDAYVAKLSADGTTLIWASFLGGASYDRVDDLTVDSSDSPIVVGGTNSTDFPVTPGAFDTSFNGDGGGMVVPGDAFVTKIKSTGASLTFSTYLGGWTGDSATAVTVDSAGHVVVTGGTLSSDFPTTALTYDGSHNGSEDVFVSVFNADGTALTLSSFLGASGAEVAGAVALGPTGDIYLTGLTYSSGFPVTPGAFRTTPGESFVTRLDPVTRTLVYSTFLAPEGHGRALAVDAAGQATIAGDTGDSFPVTTGAYDTTYSGNTDGFVIRLTASGGGALFGTYLGGSDADHLYGVALDGDRIAVMGETRSSNFPTTIGAYDRVMDSVSPNDEVFAAELGANAGSLLYSTFLGGKGDDNGRAGHFRTAGREWTIIGFTNSSDYPTTPGAFDRTLESGSGFDGYDAFVTRLRLGPVLEFHGTPFPGVPCHYTVSGAPSSETGFQAQVVISCSGAEPGTRLPGGLILPIVLDGCTQIGLNFGFLFRGTLDALGATTTATIPFPSIGPGIAITSAAFTWDTATGQVSSVTPSIKFVTL